MMRLPGDFSDIFSYTLRSYQIASELDKSLRVFVYPMKILRVTVCLSLLQAGGHLPLGKEGVGGILAEEWGILAEAEVSLAEGISFHKAEEN